MTCVLSVNAGSSSLKFALFQESDPPRRVFSEQIERIGSPGGPADHASCVDLVMERVRQSGETVGAVGHRIVHGGPRYLESSKITSEDRKSTRLNSSHLGISYAVFCLKKKRENQPPRRLSGGGPPARAERHLSVLARN